MDTTADVLWDARKATKQATTKARRATKKAAKRAQRVTKKAATKARKAGTKAVKRVKSAAKKAKASKTLRPSCIFAIRRDSSRGRRLRRRRHLHPDLTMRTSSSPCFVLYFVAFQKDSMTCRPVRSYGSCCW